MLERRRDRQPRRRVDCQQLCQQRHGSRAEHLCHGRDGAVGALDLLARQVRGKSTVCEEAEAWAEQRPGGAPRVVPHKEGEYHYAQREGVSKEGVVLLTLVHLRCLIAGLATDAMPTAVRARSPEIDDTHRRSLGLRVREKYVLQAEVAVGDALRVDVVNGLEDMNGESPRASLAVHLDALEAALQPREEVTAGTVRDREAELFPGLLGLPPEDPHEVANAFQTCDLAQTLCSGNILPWELCLLRAFGKKGFRAVGRPRMGHRLDCDQPAGQPVLGKFDMAAVARCRLQHCDMAEAPCVPLQHGGGLPCLFVLLWCNDW
mmetsp:Transcript_70902/g.229536  ORF Transcript_70902/g.229536 Transcript_70902/m.229536 type:complete len:319 (-) Transcript_70902:209-1165(-)